MKKTVRNLTKWDIFEDKDEYGHISLKYIFLRFKYNELFIINLK